MKEKDKKVLKRIEEEVGRIKEGKSYVYFFITSTHGIFDETFDYVYKMAYLLKEAGYNVGLIHQDGDKYEPNEWLSSKAFNDIPVYDISKGEVSVGVADLLFVPEVFTSVMGQTKNLPCKRVAIIQNMTYLTRFMPITSQFGDFGIIDYLTFDESESEWIKSMFPYMKEHIAHTYVDTPFFSNNEYKDMCVNIVSRSEDTVNQIAKQFYWKYPLYKWITFKDMRSLTQEEYAEHVKMSPITIWTDPNADNGIEILEALAGKNIVIARIPEMIPSWFKDENGSLNDAAVWVNSIQEIPEILANLIRMFITDSVPEVVTEAARKKAEEFTRTRSQEEICKVVSDILSEREKELENIVAQIKSKDGRH